MAYSVVEIDRARIVMAATGSAEMSDADVKLLMKNSGELGELRRRMGASEPRWLPDDPEDPASGVG